MDSSRHGHQLLGTRVILNEPPAGHHRHTGTSRRGTESGLGPRQTEHVRHAIQPGRPPGDPASGAQGTSRKRGPVQGAVLQPEGFFFEGEQHLVIADDLAGTDR